ncbi:unnamed protein product [Natator depressus]
MVKNLQLHLSNETVAQHIDEIASDIKVQLIKPAKYSPKYTLQHNESRDISNSAQLLVYVRYCYDRKLQEDLLFCNSLQGKTTGQEIFCNLDNFMQEEGLEWSCCVCKDWAGPMMEKKIGLKAKVLEVVPNVVFIQCVIHREALASKTVEQEFNCVLLTAIKIMNSVKSHPLNSRLFLRLCREMESQQE